MFDRTTHVHAAPSGPSRVDVHEHRAPTDESIRLLSEMREKTLREVVGTYDLRTPFGPCRMTVVQDYRQMFRQLRGVLVVTFGGEEHLIDEAVDVDTLTMREGPNAAAEKLVEVVHRRLADVIAATIVHDGLRTLEPSSSANLRPTGSLR